MGSEVDRSRIVMDLGAGTVLLGDREVTLNRRCRDALAAMAPGRVVSRAALATAAGLTSMSDRRPDAVIGELRRVLGHDAIRTVRSRGWHLTVPVELVGDPVAPGAVG